MAGDKLKTKSKVKVDNSFVDLLMQYMSNASDSIFDLILRHPAGRKTYTHARQFGNTNSDVDVFWRDLLKHERLLGVKYLERASRNLEYIHNNLRTINDAINEVSTFAPSDYVFDCKLYPILGYDIGIVSEGDAFLNVGHRHFFDDPRELVYYTMHELHHVCYTYYHPIFALSDILTSKDLLDVVLYCAHMEGLAVYCPLSRRLSEQGLHDEDYRVLLDPSECITRVEEFFEICSKLRKAGTSPLRDSDFEILNLMSGREKRLWYVTGAYMAKQIDTHLGRNILVDTIVRGSRSFFDEYERISH